MARKPISTNYTEIVQPTTETIEISVDQTNEEKASWAVVQAQRQEFAYLRAFTTSYTRYQDAMLARNGQAMARQAEAMVRFADLALEKSRSATLQRYEFVRLVFTVVEKALESLTEDGVDWEDKLKELRQKSPFDVLPVQMQKSLFKDQLSEVEIGNYKQTIQSLNPERIKDFMNQYRGRLQVVMAVREQLSKMNSKANWPEPPDINGLEYMQRNSRFLLQQVLRTRIVLSLDLAGEAPKGWWAIPTGMDQKLDEKSQYKSFTSGPLAPGEYDIYAPLLLARNVQVEAGRTTIVPLSSGIRISVADLVPPRDPGSGRWGATLPGRLPDEWMNWSNSNDTLLLAPGQYDVYWKQQQIHTPILLASNVEVKENEVATVVVNSALRIEVSDWVPKRDPGSGRWGATLPGRLPDEWVNWSNSNDTLLLVPGQYDVYWKQQQIHAPILLASNVEVKENTLITIPAKSGIKLKVPADTPALDANPGWWGVTSEGGRADQPIHWVKGEFDLPLLLPPGTYDIVWKQDNNHQPIKVKQSVVVQDNVLLEVEVQPPEL